jgi:hypothetical protein
MLPYSPGPKYLNDSKSAIPTLDSDSKSKLHSLSVKEKKKKRTSRFEITGIVGYKEYEKDLAAKSAKEGPGYIYN